MIATPDTISPLGEGLDHPEGVCIAPDGTIYAGGEAGQLYHIAPDGTQTQIADTGGFLLGLALDGDGNIHACDMGRKEVLRTAPDGAVAVRSAGVTGRPFTSPNYPAFAADGRLFVSESGDYWDAAGTGAIFVIRPDDTTKIFHSGPFHFANGLAIDAADEFLYIAQSSAWNVVRVPLAQPDGPIEIVYTLPPHSVADGLAFTDDGRLVICCYRPDIVYLGEPGGGVSVLVEDLTAELLLRPTNAALHDGKLYFANLGGWHLSVMETNLRPGAMNRPRLSDLRKQEKP